MSLYNRVVLLEGVGDELRSKVQAVLSSRDHKAAHDLGKWFADKFHVNVGRTPRGGKQLKKDAASFWHFLSTSWMQTSSNLPPHLASMIVGKALTHDNWKSIERRWKQDIEPNLDKYVKMFTDEGGVSVPIELKVGKRLYKNQQGFTEKRLRGIIAKLEPIWKKVKGRRAHAFDGGLVVVLQRPKNFRGTSKGVYKSELDEMWVRAVPKVLKQMGSYGGLDYILLHELGHRFERKARSHMPSVDFDRPEWYTTKYSRADSWAGSESFAELFVLGIQDWPQTNWSESPEAGKAVVAKFEKLMGR